MNKVILFFALILSLNTHAQVLQWATAFSGTTSATVESVVADNDGNVFSAGSYGNNTDFDPGPGVVNMTTSTGVSNAFIAKQDAFGNLVWVKVITGTSSKAVVTIKLDAAGNIYACGNFQGTADFNPGGGTYNLTSMGGLYSDAFVMKLDVSGNFLWAVRFSGIINNTGDNLVLDNDGNIFIGGAFNGSQDFNPGAGVFTMTSAGNGDVFVSKLDNNGNFLWAKRLGGTALDSGGSIATDLSGNVYVTGRFNGTSDYDPGAGTYSFTSIGAYDGFIAKLDGAGNFVWANQFGGTGDQKGSAITIDFEGNVILAGNFSNTVDFDPGLLVNNLVSNTATDIFMAKYGADGNLKWAKQFVGPILDDAFQVRTDPDGGVYSVGTFTDSADFDPGLGMYMLHTTDAADGYIAKLDSLGNFVWASHLNNGGERSIFIDESFNVYTAGYFGEPTDFKPGTGVYILTQPGSVGSDAFVRKLSPCAPSTASISPIACDSYTVPSGDESYTSSGIYMDTIFNATLCDSIITINLMIKNSTSSTVTDTACYSYVSPSGNYTWIASGNYLDTIPNHVGCDSVISIHLTIGVSHSNISLTVCDSYTSPSGGHIWTTSGNYLDTIPNSIGCDSIIHLSLIVGHPSASAQTITACDSYIVPTGDETYTISGTYNETIATVHGCDRVLTIHLTINSVNASVTLSGQQLNATETGATYQWVKCPSMTLVSGATSQSFTPTTNGSYAVIVTKNGCTKTSVCQTVSGVGIVQNDFSDGFSLYPNPNDGEFFVDLGDNYHSITQTVTDLNGKVIQLRRYEESQLIKVSIAEPAGVYLLVIEAGDKRAVVRIVKE